MKQFTIDDIENYDQLSEEQKLKAAEMIKDIPTQEGYLTPAAKFFKENHWVKIENVIDRKIANFLYEYVKLEAYRLSVIEQTIDIKDPDYDESVWGHFHDPQAPGDFSRYGDLTFDTILAGINHQMEESTGLKLSPTYSYHRLYTNGTELKRHKDRPSCEISATMCIGYDISNLQDKNPNYNWSMSVKNQNEEASVELNPGDILIYKGCELEHWREPFKGINQAQAFFHFNEKQGKYDILYDCRPALGLTQHFRNEEELIKHKNK